MQRTTDFGPAPIDVPAAYPGTWPDRDVLVDPPDVHPLPTPATVRGATRGRTPVVAVGSNACPAQLERKAMDGPVVLTRTTLHDHLVVYAAHQTTYGAIPATAHPWPGARTEVFVTWLTAAQHAHMDRTEGAMYRRTLVETTDGPIEAYRAMDVLRLHGAPVRLAGITAHGPDLPPALPQAAALDRWATAQ